MRYLRAEGQGGMEALETGQGIVDEGNCFLNLGASPKKSFERKRRGEERETERERDRERERTSSLGRGQGN